MTIKYRGYTIKRKGDLPKSGYYHRGFYLHEGFVVTDGSATNVMPGACWFRTPEHAAFAIDDLIEVGGEQNAAKFWELNEIRLAKIGQPKEWRN